MLSQEVLTKPPKGACRGHPGTQENQERPHGSVERQDTGKTPGEKQLVTRGMLGECEEFWGCHRHKRTPSTESPWQERGPVLWHGGLGGMVGWAAAGNTSMPHENAWESGGGWSKHGALPSPWETQMQFQVVPQLPLEVNQWVTEIWLSLALSSSTKCHLTS